MANIHEILKKHWGYDAFRPLQEEIICSVLAGKDTLALLPTGGGKSICFQVPALALDGLCLVISPLIALMKDQVQHLNQKGIKAVTVYSGMPYRQVDALLDNCIYGGVKFLYISPERLAGEDFLMRMQKMKISLLAVDEAHCISQWGYDFRPPYLKIAEVRKQLKNVPVIALTATATPEVAADIQDKLLFKERNLLQKSFVRKNLSYVVRQTVNKEKSLLDILQKVKGTGIVYVRNRRRTKNIADFLNKNGIVADYYHAGLNPDERSKKQDRWVSGKTRLICCTNAFGMGIDKPDVRAVIHMDLAESIEAYFQEAGRAGRDGKKAYAVQLLENSDLVELNKKLKEGYPEPGFIKEVYEALCSYLRVAMHCGMNESFDFDLGSFAEKNKFNPASAIQALKILEQQEIIYLSDSSFAPAQIKAIAPKETMHRFQTENKKLEPLVKFILRTSEGVFDDFVSLDEQAIAPRLKISMEETIAQLKTLDKFRIFSYKPRRNNAQLFFLQNRVSKKDLRLDIDFIKKRGEDFRNRLKAIHYYVTENNICRTRLLVQYFGEVNTDDCGICDVCVARKKSGLSATEFSAMVKTIEKELVNSPTTTDKLKNKLNLKSADLHAVLDFLSDAGKVEWLKTGELTLKQ